MPKFSVVIGVYNKEAHIAATLQAVLNQTVQDFEIVILNDGSTDTSKKIIEGFKDERIRFFDQENQGAGAARNFVIRKATGAYIALLDADDIWHPYYLEEQTSLISQFPKEAVFATAREIYDGRNTYRSQYSLPVNNLKPILINYFEGSHLDSVLHSSTTVLKRDVFDQVGYYDPAIRNGQDTDLYVRIGLQYNVVFSPRVCVKYLVIEDSLFRTARKVSDRANFKRYEYLEQDHPQLKRFLDQNRYSLCLLAKRTNDSEAFEENFHKIDLNNLNKKQQQLLKLPGSVIRILIKFKKLADRFGIRPVIRK